MTDNLPAHIESAIPSEVMLQQVAMIQDVMEKAMTDGEHFGVIPGCGDRPTLLKPGAEKLCMMFRLAPKYDIEILNHENGHREYEIVCSLYHIETEKFWGQGVGSCSTMESKYRYRNKNKLCPICGKETIIKGKDEYGGGWLCWTKKDGCGAKWNDGDAVIESQESGKIEYEDPADYYNTVKKMSKKRALVDATLTATAASDIFTQDIEEMRDFIEKKEPVKEPATKKSTTETELLNFKKLISDKLGYIVKPEEMEQFELFLTILADRWNEQQGPGTWTPASIEIWSCNDQKNFNRFWSEYNRK